VAASAQLLSAAGGHARAGRRHAYGEHVEGSQGEVGRGSHAWVVDGGCIQGQARAADMPVV